MSTLRGESTLFFVEGSIRLDFWFAIQNRVVSIGTTLFECVLISLMKQAKSVHINLYIFNRE